MLQFRCTVTKGGGQELNGRVETVGAVVDCGYFSLYVHQSVPPKHMKKGTFL